MIGRSLGYIVLQVDQFANLLENFIKLWTIAKLAYEDLRNFGN